MQVKTEMYGEKWLLNSQKACFLIEHKILIISDLHIGKLSHFRKAGIGIPTIGEEENLNKITSLLNEYKPREVIFLGDLFHSDKSEVWERFKSLLKDFDQIQFELILGNHDVFIGNFFSDLSHLKLSTERTINGLLFTHEPIELTEFTNDIINICGHIHPAVMLRGKGRQKLRVPCFYFGSRQAILPAFGSFTGTFVIETKKTDEVFVVMDDEILKF